MGHVHPFSMAMLNNPRGPMPWRAVNVSTSSHRGVESIIAGLSPTFWRPCASWFPQACRSIGRWIYHSSSSSSSARLHPPRPIVFPIGGLQLVGGGIPTQLWNKYPIIITYDPNYITLSGWSFLPGPLKNDGVRQWEGWHPFINYGK